MKFGSYKQIFILFRFPPLKPEYAIFGLVWGSPEVPLYAYHTNMNLDPWFYCLTVASVVSEVFVGLSWFKPSKK